MDIGQAVVTALVLECQSLVVNPEQVETGGMEVVNVHFIFNHAEPRLIRLPEGKTLFRSPTTKSRHLNLRDLSQVGLANPEIGAVTFFHLPSEPTVENGKTLTPRLPLFPLWSCKLKLLLMSVLIHKVIAPTSARSETAT